MIVYKFLTKDRDSKRNTFHTGTWIPGEWKSLGTRARLEVCATGFHFYLHPLLALVRDKQDGGYLGSPPRGHSISSQFSNLLWVAETRGTLRIHHSGKGCARHLRVLCPYRNWLKSEKTKFSCPDDMVHSVFKPFVADLTTNISLAEEKAQNMLSSEWEVPLRSMDETGITRVDGSYLKDKKALRVSISPKAECGQRFREPSKG